MSRRRTGKTANDAQKKKGGLDPVEAQVDGLITSSKPAPEYIQHEVHEAIDRLGAIFRVDRALTDALKVELGVRLLTAQSPDVFIYGPKRRPERLILLNYLETDGKCRVDPAAVHEECAHAIRSMFHPIETPMLQEFFGALGPILALDKRIISGGPLWRSPTLSSGCGRAAAISKASRTGSPTGCEDSSRQISGRRRNQVAITTRSPGASSKTPSAT